MAKMAVEPIRRRNFSYSVRPVRIFAAELEAELVAFGVEPVEVRAVQVALGVSPIEAALLLHEGSPRAIAVLK